MVPIIIQTLDGANYQGTWWAVSEGDTDLEVYETKRKAIDKARNQFAYPEQAIKVKHTDGTVETIREADETAAQGGQGGGGGPLPGMDNGLPGMGGNNGGGGLF